MTWRFHDYPVVVKGTAIEGKLNRMLGLMKWRILLEDFSK
jgi:hypothetical protein